MKISLDAMEIDVDLFTLVKSAVEKGIEKLFRREEDRWSGRETRGPMVVAVDTAVKAAAVKVVEAEISEGIEERILAVYQQLEAEIIREEVTKALRSKIKKKLAAGEIVLPELNLSATLDATSSTPTS